MFKQLWSLLNVLPLCKYFNIFLFFESNKEGEPKINRCFEDDSLYNTIVLTKDGQRENLPTTLGDTIITLLNEGECVKVYTDDGNTDIIVIQHEHDENLGYWGGASLQWITESEEALLLDNRLTERYHAAGYEVDEWGNVTGRIKDKEDNDEEEK